MAHTNYDRLSFLKVDKDIFLATVYISPENSSQNVSDMVSVYEQLLVDRLHSLIFMYMYICDAPI